jgi:hypothetical protein
MGTTYTTAEDRDSASGGHETAMSTGQHNQVYATTCYTLKAGATHVFHILGSPPAIFLFEKKLVPEKLTP